MKKTLIIVLVLIVIGLICYFSFFKKEQKIDSGLSESQPEESVGLANPASVHCQEQGGELSIKDFESGQKGFCLFSDGSQCEEWDFFRGDCSKGQLKIEVLQEGAGILADKNDTVSVHYSGYLQDGTKFDSSVDRGQPFSFVLGTNFVIKGWEYGILGMQPGEKRKLTIAPELAYGVAGAGNIIPPNATLIFEVELLEIK